MNMRIMEFQNFGAMIHRRGSGARTLNVHSSSVDGGAAMLQRNMMIVAVAAMAKPKTSDNADDDNADHWQHVAAVVLVIPAVKCRNRVQKGRPGGGEEEDEQDSAKQFAHAPVETRRRSAFGFRILRRQQAEAAVSRFLLLLVARFRSGEAGHTAFGQGAQVTKNVQGVLISGLSWVVLVTLINFGMWSACMVEDFWATALTLRF